MLVVYGTRPEVIKLAPVVEALSQRHERFSVSVCCTAQHRELVDDVQELFAIRPDFDLNLMRPNQSLNELAGRGFVEIGSLLNRVDADWILVQGDTTTAMVTALAAFQKGRRLGHVEAGLRTGDLGAPFPEEANRRVIDLVAGLRFAPTSTAEKALLGEGHAPETIHRVGNTGIDALHWVAKRLPEEPPASEVLVTVHRRESFGPRLVEIFEAIRDLASRFPGVQWILPVHPNPNVVKPARETLAGLENLQLRSPLRYDGLVRHLRRARIVLTDSGGIQEEAPTFGKPVLVLREKTERPEGVEAGVARLVGTRRERIVEEASRLLTDETAYRRMARRSNPYGDGRAAERIAAILAGEPYELFSP